MCPLSCIQSNFLLNVLVAPNWLDPHPSREGISIPAPSVPSSTNKKDLAQLLHALLTAWGKPRQGERDSSSHEQGMENDICEVPS